MSIGDAWILYTIFSQGTSSVPDWLIIYRSFFAWGELFEVSIFDGVIVSGGWWEMTRMFKSFVREVWLELLELIEMCKVCFTYPFFFFFWRWLPVHVQRRKLGKPFKNLGCRRGEGKENWPKWNHCVCAHMWVYIHISINEQYTIGRDLIMFKLILVI